MGTIASNVEYVSAEAESVIRLVVALSIAKNNFLLFRSRSILEVRRLDVLHAK